MPRQVVLGDNSSACPQMTLLAVRPGDTITVVSNASSVSQVASTNHPNNSKTLITLGATQTFTEPTWLSSTGRASFTVSGGIYGP